jgi:hypothetical protein
MFEEESGTPMWREWRTTVWQISLEVIVRGECAVEADRRKSQHSSLALNSGRTGVSLWRRRRRRRR